MKLKAYYILFNLCSFFADKTGGYRFFVKYKLLLGSIVLGLTNSSCKTNHGILCATELVEIPVIEVPYPEPVRCYMPAYIPIEVTPIDRFVTGTVVDENNEPLIGVSVIVMDTEKKTQSDIDGKFGVDFSVTEIIRFQYLGYKTVECVLSEIGTNPVVIKMEKDPIFEEKTSATICISRREVPKIQTRRIYLTVQSRTNLTEGISIDQSSVQKQQKKK